MKRFLIVFFALLVFKSGETAEAITRPDSVYSLPFHIDAGLVVFKGQMNGVDTDFAFDTGASMGLANSLAEPADRLKVKGKKNQNAGFQQAGSQSPDRTDQRNQDRRSYLPKSPKPRQ